MIEESTHAPPRQWPVVVMTLALATGLAVTVATQNASAPRSLLRVLVGLALGATLLGTDFGFAGAFRKAVTARDLSGLRAHLVAFAVAMVLIVPMVAIGELFGQPIEGVAHRVGVGFLVGALLFGVGMQLAGGCASGTLYQLGGGSAKHVGTLVGFVLGSVIAASHVELWWRLPSLPAITLFSAGHRAWPLMLLAELAAIAIALGATGRELPPRKLMIGALLLAMANAATVLVSGRPWSETWAFTLWGAQLAARAGAHPEAWRIFQGTAHDTGPFVDGTSIMDLAIPIGAALAAGLLGTFSLRRSSPRAWLAASIGGLAMGYGARLSGGCNIGAYFSAIASGDLSGWAWALAGAAGSIVGVRLRARIEPATPAP